MDADASDKADMQSLAGGNPQALDALMQRHAVQVAGFLYRVLQSSDAEDLTQEVFLRVFKHANQYDSHQKFSTWLFAIASNLAKNHKRWWFRHPTESLDDITWDHFATEEPNPAQASERTELRRKVRLAIAALPVKLRVPLILAEYENKSQQEISEILGCSIKSVESCLYRSRRQLAEALKDLLKD